MIANCRKGNNLYLQNFVSYADFCPSMKPISDWPCKEISFTMHSISYVLIQLRKSERNQSPYANHKSFHTAYIIIREKFKVSNQFPIHSTILESKSVITYDLKHFTETDTCICTNYQTIGICQSRTLRISWKYCTNLGRDSGLGQYVNVCMCMPSYVTHVILMMFKRYMICLADYIPTHISQVWHKSKKA